MVACLYFDIFTLDSLSTPFVCWRTSQIGSSRRRDFGHANLWPAAMAGEHAKLGVRLNKTFDSSNMIWHFTLTDLSRMVFILFDAFSLPLAYQQGMRSFIFGFKLKVYHQYPGYFHTRREKHRKAASTTVTSKLNLYMIYIYIPL